GTVMLWDRGSWAPQEDPHEGLKKGSLKIVLNGERLKGGFALVRMKPRPGEKSSHENWLLIKERDDWADDTFVATEAWTESVKTGRNLNRIEREGEAYKHGKTYAPAGKTVPAKKNVKKKVNVQSGPRAKAPAAAKPKAKSAPKTRARKAKPRAQAERV